MDSQRPVITPASRMHSRTIGTILLHHVFGSFLFKCLFLPEVVRLEMTKTRVIRVLYRPTVAMLMNLV
jgi:hypothetical protein